jgi:hypothetical protein
VVNRIFVISVQILINPPTAGRTRGNLLMVLVQQISPSPYVSDSRISSLHGQRFTVKRYDFSLETRISCVCQSASFVMRDRSGIVTLFWFLILWMSTPQLSVSGFSIGSRVSSMRTFTVPMQERTDLASFIFHRQVSRDARERRVLSIWKLRLSSDFGSDFEKLSDEQ